MFEHSGMRSTSVFVPQTWKKRHQLYAKDIIFESAHFCPHLWSHISIISIASYWVPIEDTVFYSLCSLILVSFSFLGTNFKYPTSQASCCLPTFHPSLHRSAPGNSLLPRQQAEVPILRKDADRQNNTQQIKLIAEGRKGGCMKCGGMTYGRTQSNRRGTGRTFGGYIRQLRSYLVSSTRPPKCH